MSPAAYLEQTGKLLSRIFGVQLRPAAIAAVRAAHEQGLTPGQLVLLIARHDGLRPL